MTDAPFQVTFAFTITLDPNAPAGATLSAGSPDYRSGFLRETVDDGTFFGDPLLPPDGSGEDMLRFLDSLGSGTPVGDFIKVYYPGDVFDEYVMVTSPGFIGSTTFFSGHIGNIDPTDTARVEAAIPDSYVEFILGYTDSVDFTPPCFLTGTRIATPGGDSAVEDLAPGDLVLTVDGLSVPVVWVGHRRVLKRFGLPERNKLVRIRAGALGPGVPNDDLCVTGDHALALGGYLVNAAALVDGDAIDWADSGPAYTVYHVETEAHEVLLANGAPAESFCDYADRAQFDNHRDLKAHAASRMIREHNLPRVSSARLLPPHLRRTPTLASA